MSNSSDRNNESTSRVCEQSTELGSNQKYIYLINIFSQNK